MVTSYLYGNSKKDNINYSYITTVDNTSAVNEEKKTNLLTTEQRYITLPSFTDMVKYIYEQAEKKASSNTPRNSGKMHLAYTYDVYSEILDYLRLCLLLSAGINDYPDEATKNNLIGHYIRTLCDAKNLHYIEKYNELIKCMVISRKGYTELGCLFDLISAAPELLVPLNIDLLEPLNDSLREISESNRTIIAKIYGIILAYGVADDSIFHNHIDDLLAVQSKSLEHQHGSVLASSHALYRKLCRFKKENRIRFENLDGWLPLERTVTLLVSLLTSSYHLLMKASIEGIGFIGSVVALPLNEESSEKDNMEIDGSESHKLIIYCTFFYYENYF